MAESSHMLRVSEPLRPLLAAVLLGAFALPAQDRPVRAPAGAPVDDADEIYAWMSDAAHVESKGDWVAYVGASGREYQIVENLEGDFVVQTPLGRTFVDSWRIDDEEAIDFASLVAAAKAAGAVPDRSSDDEIKARLWWTPGLGDTFGTDDGFVERFGKERAFRLVDAGEPARRGDVQQLRLEAARAAGPLGDLLRGEDYLASALRAALDGLAPLTEDELDNERSAAGEPVLMFTEDTEMPSQSLRRMVRHGWLGQVAPDLRGAEEVLEAVLDAEQLLPAGTWESDDGCRVVRLRDAFDREVWQVVDGDVQHVAVRHPMPHHFEHQGATIGSAWLEYQLATDADPFDRATLLAASRVTLRLWGEPMAVRVGGRLGSDESWSDWLHETDYDHDNALVDCLPPHLALVDLAGDLLALSLPRGELPAPGNGSADDAWLDRAAELLKGARHLDLIGEYLFVYAWDSPDPNLSLAVGTPGLCGDRQHTALETLGTACGGEIRGDCDDLAALTVDLLRRQGLFALEMGTPEHASTLWVEPTEEGWSAFVLQTGPTLEFTGDSVREVIDAVYYSEDPTIFFDPEAALGLHRFPGDNSLTDVYVPLGVFTDPELATDVFARAELLHAGALAAATERVRRSVERFPGQLEPRIALADLLVGQNDHATAAEVFRGVLEDAQAFATRTKARVGLIECLVRLGEDRAAARQFDRLLAADLPDLGWDGGVLQRGILVASFADRLLRPESMALFERLVDAVLLAGLDPSLDRCARGLEFSDAEAQGEDAWETVETDDLPWFDPWLLDHELDDATARLHFALEWMAAGGADEAARRREIEPLLDRYVRTVVGIPDATSWLRWSSLAAVGTWLHRAEAAGELGADGPLPARCDALQTLLSGEAEPLFGPGEDWRPVLTPLVALSPYYWWGEIGNCFRPERDGLDLDEIAGLAVRLEAACSTLDQIGWLDPSLEAVQRDGLLMAALARADQDEVRRLFAVFGARNDRGELEWARVSLAMAARFLSVDDYAALLAIWHETIDHPPSVWWHAWLALEYDAPSHAVHAAEDAARRTADDPRFAGELAAVRAAAARATR